MGGEISLESEVGQGSTFRFTITCPIDRHTAIADLRESSDAEQTLSHLAIPDRRLHVLQVEDNEVNRAVVEKILTTAGHEVINTTNGIEALAALDVEHFDIILMDRHMQEMNGLDTTVRIRARRDDKSLLPIVGITASAIQSESGVTVMGFKVASRVRGLSDEAFGEAFGTKEQCRAALVRLRWPGGFVCPCCGHREHCVLAGRGLYQCNRCKKQTSPTAGTIFHATKLPLTLWFAAIHLIVTAKNGISSVELGRRLGVKQPTAWAVKHKIMAVMARREGETALTGRVEMDDAYLGGVRSGGKRGRGAAGKTPFVAAVSTSPEGRPRKLKLAPVKGFRKREIARGAKHWLAPGAAVVTDGLGCWSALEEAACSHQAIRTGSGRQAARMASFKSVNTTLGNIKSAITGTYRKLGPDHPGRYLASFAWRYNPRYQLQTMIPRFVHSAARTQPMPYRLLIAG